MKKRLFAILIVLAAFTGCNGNAPENNPPITQIPSVTQTPGVTQKGKSNQASAPTPTIENASKDTTVQNNEKEYVLPKMEGEISISTMFEQEYLTIA